MLARFDLHHWIDTLDNNDLLAQVTFYKKLNFYQFCHPTYNVVTTQHTGSYGPQNEDGELVDGIFMAGPELFPSDTMWVEDSDDDEKVTERDIVTEMTDYIHTDTGAWCTLQVSHNMEDRKYVSTVLSLQFKRGQTTQMKLSYIIKKAEIVQTDNLEVALHALATL